jgi:hypothetical protein
MLLERMWVVENKHKVFFYQENGGQVEGTYKIVIKIVICLSPLAYKPNGNDVMTWP